MNHFFLPPIVFSRSFIKQDSGGKISKINQLYHRNHAPNDAVLKFHHTIVPSESIRGDGLEEKLFDAKTFRIS
jgi:predicted GNAT family acetyltransferase